MMSKSMFFPVREVALSEARIRETVVLSVHTSMVTGARAEGP